MSQAGHEENWEGKPAAPAWLWRSVVSLLALVVGTGLGLVVALALGWRTPTPHRAPDWTATASTWRQYGDGTATVAGKSYHLRLSQADQHAWAIAGQQVADFVLELDARSLLPSEDAGYGLLYRYQDPANYYLFNVGGDGYYTVAVVRQGALTPLRPWQEWPHVRRGAATNRLRVQCAGAACRFYVNGEFTAEVIDDTFLSGDVGLWGQTFSDEALDVVFEGMRMWSSDAPLVKDVPR